MRRSPKRLSWLAIFSLVVLLAGQAWSSNSETTEVAISSYETDAFRRIKVHSAGTGSDAVSVIPDSANGRFTILIRNTDVLRYKGDMWLKDAGAYPLDAFASFPDSLTLRIDGRTNPFNHCETLTDLANNCYVFDFYTAGAPFIEKASLTTQLTAGYPSDGTGPEDNPSNRMVSKASLNPFTKWGDQLMRSIKLAGIAWVLLMAGLITARSYSPRIDKLIQSTLTVFDRPTAEPEKTSDSHQKGKKEATARDLMVSRGITYDEASILLSLNNGSGKIDMKA